jgi:hypothetical protein
MIARLLRPTLLVLSLLTIAPAISAAHVGSPDVVFEGSAGSYPVRVIVRPPQVVPGLAEVVVRVLRGNASRVLIQPVFWRAGRSGAPSPDETKPVRGSPNTYSGQLWLMARGAYSVYVMVEGPAGSGTVNVPVMSDATGRLGMNPALGSLLAALGIVLLVGLGSIVYAAAGEGVAEPGRPLDASRRRRARLAVASAAAVMALAVFGGAKWWQSVDEDYQSRMYRPLATNATVTDDSAGARLHFTVVDGTGKPLALDPLIPDHGKLMHLFVIDSGTMRVFAHLHPVFDGASTFTTPLPPLPPGRYHLYGDVVFENGQSRTLVGMVTLDTAGATHVHSLGDADDGWTTANGVDRRGATSAVVRLEDGSSMEWLADSTPIRPGTPATLHFRVRDATGAPAMLEPYMGMSAHAVIARTDGAVFVHLHPMGTISPAAQEVFALRDRGDTTATGRLRPGPTSMAANAMMLGSDFSIPYEFPRSGTYRVWVQVRRAGRVLTGAFTVSL